MHEDARVEFSAVQGTLRLSLTTKQRIIDERTDTPHSVSSLTFPIRAQMALSGPKALPTGLGQEPGLALYRPFRALGSVRELTECSVH